MLHEIGAADVPQLLVFNKIDLLDPSQRPLQASDLFELDGVQVPRVFVSGATGEGLPALRQQLALALSQRKAQAPAEDAGAEIRETSA